MDSSDCASLSAADSVFSLETSSPMLGLFKTSVLFTSSSSETSVPDASSSFGLLLSSFKESSEDVSSEFLASVSSIFETGASISSEVVWMISLVPVSSSVNSLF